MSHDNPYDLLGDDNDDGQRWAFGTGFTDPLEGIDTTVPDGLDADALARYCLALGDDALEASTRRATPLTDGRLQRRAETARIRVPS